MSPAVSELDILFKDDHIVMVNKPSGVASHATDRQKAHHLTDLVGRWLRDHDISVEGSLAPANRLDLDASGVVAFAITAAARSALGQAFHDRLVKKAYIAITAGRMRNKGVVNRDVPDQRGKKKPARSRYRLIATTNRVSLVKVQIETGRKHQIRRHMASIGHPILGDRRYGHTRAAESFRKRFELDRIMLHARQMSCTHPMTGNRLHVVCSPGEDWDRVEERLGLTLPPDEATL